MKKTEIWRMQQIQYDRMKWVWQEAAPTWTGMNVEHIDSGKTNDDSQVKDVEPTAKLLAEVVLQHSHSLTETHSSNQSHRSSPNV